jgi:hypothetical protein
MDMVSGCVEGVRMRANGLHRGAVALAGLAMLGLAGCGSKGEDAGNTLGNLFAYQSAKAPPVAATASSPRDIGCPAIAVAEGQAAYRVYAGSDHSNDAVKQQFSLGDLSRECSARDSQLTMRVGVAGYVQAGPVGGPGSFSVPIRLVVRRESDQQIVATKSYRVAATIPAGDTQAPFTLVTEPISVPALSNASEEDYTIYVGFDSGATDKPQKPKPRRRAR